MVEGCGKYVFDKEIEKIGRLHPQSPEYSAQFEYLNTIVSLPWEEYSVDKSFSLDRAEKILNRDHYGLDKVKERILEYLFCFEAEGRYEVADSLSLWSSGRGQNFAGTFHCGSLGKEIYSYVSRWFARTKRRSVKSSSYLCGRDVGTYPSQYPESWDFQSSVCTG